MSNDFINGLVATAQPVARRRTSSDLLIVMGIAIVELVGLAYFFDPQIVAASIASDPTRMIAKFVVFGSLAVAAMVLAVLSFDPAARRIGGGMIAVLATALTVSMVFFDFGVGPTLGSTVLPSAGIFCAAAVTSLSLPVTLVLGILMSSGASIQPKRSAFLAGLAGGAFGAFLFSLQCPQVSFWYLALWYGMGIAVVSAVSMVMLPRMVRW